MEAAEKEIVIIGAGLTGLSLAYYLKKAGKSVLVIEQDARTGGVINTITENGFTYETGPSTGVLGSLELAELFEELEGKCRLEIADKQAKKRYIWKGSRWEALPGGHDLKAITTPLFTLSDKFRILGEPFRKAGGHPDESVAELVRRRLGKSFLDYAVDPFIGGVYAGDPEKLITRFALPKLYALEQKYGGFIRGSIAKHKERHDARQEKVTREVFSVQDGLKNLTGALESAIGTENILLGCNDVQVSVADGMYKTTFTNNGRTIEVASAKLVTTTGGYALPALLPFVDEATMKPVSETTYAGVVQVAVGYKKWDGIRLDAFGGLVPSCEKRRILGVLFPSAIFAGRTPVGGALLSVFLGGINKPEVLNMNDEEIGKVVREELQLTMRTTAAPDLLRIHRYRHAIAQYDISTGARLQSIDKIQQQYPGLILAGNIRDGIGMSDRVKQAKMIADEIIGG